MTTRKEALITVGLKLIPPGQGSKLREYYIRFEGSMYDVLHVDVEAHTVGMTPSRISTTFRCS